MRTNAPQTIVVGDLVVAAFDIAANYSRDPRLVSRLATTAVRNVLISARRMSTPSSPPKPASGPRVLWETALPGLRKAEMRKCAKEASS